MTDDVKDDGGGCGRRPVVSGRGGNEGGGRYLQVDCLSVGGNYFVI